MHLVKQSCYFNFFADMEIKFFDNICGCSSGSRKKGVQILSEKNNRQKKFSLLLLFFLIKKSTVLLLLFKKYHIIPLRP